MVPAALLASHRSVLIASFVTVPRAGDRGAGSRDRRGGTAAVVVVAARRPQQGHRGSQDDGGDAHGLHGPESVTCDGCQCKATRSTRLRSRSMEPPRKPSTRMLPHS